MVISAWPLVASLLLLWCLSSASAADSKRLGCIALEYIKAYQGECNQVGENKKPVESSFVETFAPNCGVQAKTLTNITGRFVACQSNYAPPAQAFDILVGDGKSLQILHDKTHNEVGAAVSGTAGGGPYFWCVLFSNGKPNSSFVLDGGVAKSVRPGCFSGNGDDCSGAMAIGDGTWRLVAGLVIAVACALAL